MATRKRIVLLEDLDVHRFALADELEDFGFEVVATATVEEAERIISSEHPDLLVFDLLIDDEQVGVKELVRRLRESDAHAETPIVFVSAHLNPKLKATLGLISSSAIVAKPCAPSTLLEAIRPLL